MILYKPASLGCTWQLIHEGDLTGVRADIAMHATTHLRLGISRNQALVPPETDTCIFDCRIR